MQHRMTRLVLVMIAASGLVFPTAADGPRWKPLPVQGQGDTRWYVSSSQGSDANDGLTRERPMRTINAAYRLAYSRQRAAGRGLADGLLLKAGDVFTGPRQTFAVPAPTPDDPNATYPQDYPTVWLGPTPGSWQDLNGWTLSGESAERPFVVSWYGDGGRPMIETDGHEVIHLQDGSGIRWVLIDGVGMKANRDPAPWDPVTRQGDHGASAITWYAVGGGFTCRDVSTVNFNGSFVGQSPQDEAELKLPNAVYGARGFTFERCIFDHNYAQLMRGSDGSINRTHSSGVFTSRLEGVRFSEVTVDYGGWSETVPNRHATIYNHDYYIDPSCRNVVVEDGIAARGAATGIQLRGQDMAATRNLVLQCAVGVTLGHEGSRRAGFLPATGIIADNVILDARDTDNLPRGFGYGVGWHEWVKVYRNVAACAYSLNGQEAGLDLGLVTKPGVPASAGVTYALDNVIYDWCGPAMRVAAAQPRHTTVGRNWFIAPRGTKVLQLPAGPVGGDWGFNSYSAPGPAQVMWGGQAFPASDALGVIGEGGGEAGSFYALGHAPPTIDAYVRSIGGPTSGGIDWFMQQAKAQRAATLNSQFTAAAVRNWVYSQGLKMWADEDWATDPFPNSAAGVGQ